MNDKYNYVTNLNIKFKHFEVIDIPQIVSECEDKWFNQTLTQVNGSVVRVAIIEGEYHWHKHEKEDEFFFVLKGKLLVDLEDKTIELSSGQGLTVTRNFMHKTRAPQKTVVLMVENKEVMPTGN